MIARICAWCDAVLGFKPGPPGVTHGICEGCLPRLLNGIRVIGADATNNTKTNERTETR